MKKLLSLPFFLLLSASVEAQDYQPLLIDSFYRYSVQPTFGGTIVSEDYRGYDYYDDNRLMEVRHPDARFRYEYAPDTVFLFAEQRQDDGSLAPFSRKTSVYDGELLISKRIESYNDGSYTNSSLDSYYYAPPDLDTLRLLQHWREGAWVDFYKKEKTFDTNGYPTKEIEYYVDENGVFDHNRRKLFEHNEEGQKTQEIRISSTITGDHYLSRTNWSYDSEGRLETLRRCHYEGSNENCVNQGMATYQYYGQDSIVESGFYWESNEWQYYSKELTYPGPGIYSSRPDSVIYSDYLPDADIYRERWREYFQYQELADGTLYFRGEEYTYNLQTAEWQLTELTEEWYSTPAPVSTGKQQEAADPRFLFFPNPCQPGQQLTIQNLPPGSSKLEVFIFDVQGRLCGRQTLNGNVVLQAPAQKGVYTILLRSEGRLLGAFRQVVQ